MAQPSPPAVLLTSDEVGVRVRQLATEINAWYGGGRDPHLVTVLKGGFVFLVDLMRALSRPVTIDFVAITSYGATTRSSNAPRLVKDLEQDIADRDVLVIEDIVDTGQTLSWLLTTLRSRRPRSLRTVALLDKRALAPGKAWERGISS